MARPAPNSLLFRRGSGWVTPLFPIPVLKLPRTPIDLFLAAGRSAASLQGVVPGAGHPPRWSSSTKAFPEMIGDPVISPSALPDWSSSAEQARGNPHLDSFTSSPPPPLGLEDPCLFSVGFLPPYQPEASRRLFRDSEPYLPAQSLPVYPPRRFQRHFFLWALPLPLLPDYFPPSRSLPSQPSFFITRSGGRVFEKSASTGEMVTGSSGPERPRP